MKIVFISTMKGFSWGGSEELWFEAALSAADANHEVTAVVFENMPIHGKFSLLQKAGVQIFYLKERVANIPRLGRRIVNKVLSQPLQITLDDRFAFIHELHPDLIVINQGNTLDITQYEDLKHFVAATQAPFFIINQHNNEYGRLQEDQRKFLNVFFQKASKTFFVAKRNQLVLERQCGFEIPRAVVVRNPVNLKNVDAVPVSGNNKPSFAVVARFDTNFKGQDVLLECLAGEKWQLREFSINFYGKGPDEIYIKELIAFYNLNAKAFVRNHESDIKKIWQEHDVLILPSLSEGLPLTIVEAMICGRPCLVTDVGDSAVLIEDNVNGWIADCASVRALDDALERMWSQRGEWQLMGKSAHKTAIDFFDPNPGKTFLEQVFAHE
jgi:glycosyltransferase involved in cell wall biosynthesis